MLPNILMEPSIPEVNALRIKPFYSAVLLSDSRSYFSYSRFRAEWETIVKLGECVGYGYLKVGLDFVVEESVDW